MLQGTCFAEAPSNKRHSEEAVSRGVHACRAGTATKYWIGDKDEDLARAEENNNNNNNNNTNNH